MLHCQPAPKRPTFLSPAPLPGKGPRAKSPASDGSNRSSRTLTASSPPPSKRRFLRSFSPEKTSATSVLVEARKTDPAVAGQRAGVESERPKLPQYDARMAMLRWLRSVLLFPFTIRRIRSQLKLRGPRLNIRRIAVLAAVLFPIAAVSAQGKPPKPRPESHFGSHLPPPAIAALQSSRADNIEQQVRFLSHDLLEGLGTGQRGADLAAEYIAPHFSLYGLH